jgi:hypothetical protein
MALEKKGIDTGMEYKRERESDRQYEASFTSTLKMNSAGFFETLVPYHTTA